MERMRSSERYARYGLFIEQAERYAAPSNGRIKAELILVVSKAVGASDKETPDPTQQNAGNGPILLESGAAPDEARGSTMANVNVDTKG